jgi:hypothetical protein
MLIPLTKEGPAMRVPISLITLSAACLIAGCATAYQPDGVSGGYSDRVLAANTAQVTFRGNRLTEPATVHDFLLRRCAEVTLQDGYNYFVLAHEEGPNEGNSDAFGSNVRTATIQMYQSKPLGGPHVYGASNLLRELLAEQGESEEPTSAAGSGAQVIPPPIPGATQASNDVASVASSSTPHLLASNPNPNALTNEAVHFDHW